MPRASGVYSLPAGTSAVSGQTVSSAKYNSATSDIETDLNTARPVVAGGTEKTSLASGKVLVGQGTSPVDDSKSAPTGDFVGTTDTQTLTNKTLTSPVINSPTMTSVTVDNLTVTGNTSLPAGDIATSQIADNAITLAKMEHGTSGDILYYGAAGEPFRLAKGSDNQILSLSSGLPAWINNTSATHEDGQDATTSGTAHDFTSIASGMNHIEVMLNNVSLSGSDNLLLQIGTGGAAKTSGYTASSTNIGAAVSSTAGFIVIISVAASGLTGTITLDRVPGSNTWICTHSAGIHGSTGRALGSGIATLTGELDMIRLTVSGANTFDNGAWSMRATA